jgi:hypothetical protein
VAYWKQSPSGEKCKRGQWNEEKMKIRSELYNETLYFSDEDLALFKQFLINATGDIIHVEGNIILETHLTKEQEQMLIELCKEITNWERNEQTKLFSFYPCYQRNTTHRQGYTEDWIRSSYRTAWAPKQAGYSIHEVRELAEHRL